MKFLALLKYLDQKKVTPEAVLEMAAIMGRSPSAEQAAELANAFRTRGIAGVATLLPEMLKWPHKESETTPEPVVTCCPNCGQLLELKS